MAKRRHVLDVWVCQGRMCTANGSDSVEAGVRDALAAREDADRVRVLRGGCYGLCDFGPNVVIRRYSARCRRPDPGTDRLSLTRRRNETVYSGVRPAHADELLRSHLDDDAAVNALTYDALDEALDEAREDDAGETATSSGIRKLRRKTA